MKTETETRPDKTETERKTETASRREIVAGSGNGDAQPLGSGRKEASASRQAARPLTLQQAAGIAGVSPDTVARWCKRYGIGRQLHRKAPWRVDRPGLLAVAAGDSEALRAYQASAIG